MKSLVVSLLLALVSPALMATQAQVAKPQNAVVPKNGFRADFLAGLDEVQDKLEQLAAAMPQDKYVWRPGPGVRSVGEVYGHVAGGNYFLSTFLGKQPPTDIPADLEKLTRKDDLIAQMKRSFDYLRAVVAAENDADLDKPVKMLGTTTTRRGVYMTILNHLHEHLGQSVAYARMNKIVPPWSR